MREKLLALSALQQVDLEVAALRKSAESYPKEIAELEKQLAAGRGGVDLERSRLDDLDKQRLNLEQTIVEEKDKIRKWEARLTEQRSTREYSALAREIDIAKKGQQTMSEDVVELGKQAVIQRDVVKTKGTEFETKSKDLLDRVSGLKAKLAEVEAKIAGIDVKRAEATKSVEPEMLRRYDTIRKKRMPALVPLNAPGTCTGCRMSIRAQIYNTLVQSKGYDVCPSCQRLIYADEVLAAPK